MVRLVACVLAIAACSSSKPRDDARSSSVRAGDASVAGDAAATPVIADGGPRTGDVQVRVEWRDVPVIARASPGRTPCNTPRAPAVAPTTTWGIPDVVVIVEGAPADPGDAGVALDGCAFTPRIAAAGALVIESAVSQPAKVTLAKRGTLAALPALETGTPRDVRLPIAGHAVTVPLDDGAIYEVASDGKDPETAWVIAGRAAITEASGNVIVKDLAPGPHAVRAWLPPRGGQPGRFAKGTATVVAGDLAELVLALEH